MVAAEDPADSRTWLYPSLQFQPWPRDELALRIGSHSERKASLVNALSEKDINAKAAVNALRQGAAGLSTPADAAPGLPPRVVKVAARLPSNSKPDGKSRGQATIREKKQNGTAEVVLQPNPVDSVATEIGIELGRENSPRWVKFISAESRSVGLGDVSSGSSPQLSSVVTFLESIPSQVRDNELCSELRDTSSLENLGYAPLLFRNTT